MYVMLLEIWVCDEVLNDMLAWVCMQRAWDMKLKCNVMLARMHAKYDIMHASPDMRIKNEHKPVH